MSRTTIAIDEKLKAKIAYYGRYGETPNSVIHRIFDEYDRLKHPELYNKEKTTNQSDGSLDYGR